MIFQTAIDSNYQALLFVAGLSATYRRSSTVSCQLSAAMGKSNHEVETTYGMMTSEVKDFVIKTSDLILDGIVSVPQIGDTIDIMAGTYEVIAPNGSDCYTQPDPNRKWMRIHTQMVSD